MADAQGKLRIAPVYFLIALLPATVYLLSSLILQAFGQAPDLLPERIAEFDAQREAVSRIGMLSGLMLFAGAVLAAVVYFAATLRNFGSPDWGWIVLAYLLLAGAAIGIRDKGEERTAQYYAGKCLFILAAGYDQDRSDHARAREGKALKSQSGRQAEAVPRARDKCRVSAAPAAAKEASPSGPPAKLPVQSTGVPVRYLAVTSHGGFEALERLEWWQFTGVAFSFAALVFVAIASLAEPRDAAAFARPQLDHWERQAGWLNICLYLSALLLGTALVFVNGFLRFPEFILQDAKTHQDYVGSLIAYYGVTFTVMLASFYMPVAAILSQKVRRSAVAGGGDAKLPDAFKGPLQILKIVLSLLSTTLVGILPDLVGALS